MNFAYAGLDEGNSFESGSLFTATNGTATATLTTGNYSFDVSLPANYTILVPFALFGEFEILDTQTTTRPLPLVALGTGADGTAEDSPVVVSQVYAAGGETDALYNRDFIELFNRGNSAVNLSGWSVQYADSMSGDWQVIALSGTLDPGRYYLIGAASGPNGSALPTPDAACGVALSPAGKLALADHTTPLIGAIPEEYDLADLVGYGFADWYEGLDGSAPLTDAITAALRLGHGNYDTNSNQWDFSADEPEPRNTSSSIGNRAPAVTAPDEQGTALDTSLTFSAANGNAFTVTDADAGSSDLEIALNADAGTLTLAGTTGLTFSNGDGAADESMTFTGNLTNIAAALNGLTYAPETGYRGAGFVTLWADDLGNTGTGGALVDYGSTYLVIDGPVVALDVEVETLEDTAVEIDVLANSVWLGEVAPSWSVLAQPAHGTIDIVDDLIVYTPDAEYFGTDSFTFELDDGQHTDSATVLLSIEWVNDARIENTGEPNMYAAEGELVDVTFATPDATEEITWSATSLPDGLTIDSETGQIYGRPEYYDAQTNGGAWDVALTATSASSDTETLEFTWNISDTNRLPWIDDQAQQEGQSAGVYYYAVDYINPPSEWDYDFSGLPTGMTGPNDTIPIGAAGEYDVTISMTAGGATDERTYHWLIVPAAQPIGMGQTPEPGVAAFALNDTFVHSDDVGLVGKGTPVMVKYFLTELDYFNYGNNNLGPVKLQVMAGDAGLTTDPNDTVGTSSIELTPTVGGLTWATASAYLVGHVASTAVDEIVVAAFRRINNVWMEMERDGKKNDVEITIGTGIIPIGQPHAGKPDHDRDGIVDAKTTPTLMFNANKYRIPPRNWSATDLWVTKDGPIGENKFLYLVAPRIGRPGTELEGQSDDNGRVALSKSSTGASYERFLKLVDGDFIAPSHQGEQTATIWIRGHIVAKNKDAPETGNEEAYQTKVGKAKKLWLGIFASPDDSKIETLGKEYYWTYGFSVAAIPVGKVYASKIEPIREKPTPRVNPPLANRDGVVSAGMAVAMLFNSDSSVFSSDGIIVNDGIDDLNQVVAAEAVKFARDDLKIGAAMVAGYLPVASHNLAALKVTFPTTNITIKGAMADSHAIPILRLVRSPAGGTTTFKQAVVFKEMRTGVVDIPVSYSGFQIDFNYTVDNNNIGKLVVTKTAVDVADTFTIFDDPVWNPGPPKGWTWTPRQNVSVSTLAGQTSSGGVEDTYDHATP